MRNLNVKSTGSEPNTGKSKIFFLQGKLALHSGRTSLERVAYGGSEHRFGSLLGLAVALSAVCKDGASIDTAGIMVEMMRVIEAEEHDQELVQVIMAVCLFFFCLILLDELLKTDRLVRMFL